MKQQRRRCNRKEKLHAVRRVIEDGHHPHRVAAEIDIRPEQLHTWIDRYAIHAEKGAGSLRLKTASDVLHELRREREELRSEREYFRMLLGFHYRSRT